MDIGVISARYAKALLLSALDLKQEDAVYNEMGLLSTSYLRVPELRTTIDNPMLDKDKKLALLVTASGGDVSELTKRFFQIILKSDREAYLQFMAASYITLYRQQKNITQGKLITAVAVSADTEAKMKQLVEGRTHGTVEFNTEIDPDLIGGFILEYDTYRMDASVRTKLNTILHDLVK